MRLDERDKAYLWDMLDAALAVEEFVQGQTFRDYLSNRMLRGAVERHIEIIGEAARRISEATRQALPEIPWRGIVGQRNILAHEYDEVLDEAIWGIATRRLPELIAALRAILPDEMGNASNAAVGDR
jgi:uncharacterized protein with HEPN domain